MSCFWSFKCEIMILMTENITKYLDKAFKQIILVFLQAQMQPNSIAFVTYWNYILDRFDLLPRRSKEPHVALEIEFQNNAEIL